MHIATPTLRERLIDKTLNKLTDEQVEMVLRFVDSLIGERKRVGAYDPANDPVLTGEGLLEGPSDLSERDEEILYGLDQTTDDADETP